MTPLVPRVFADAARIDSVADAPALRPGIDALGVSGVRTIEAIS